MNNIERAENLFNHGFNCSQAILTAFSEKYGLDEEMAKRLGRSLGGGIAHTAQTCGAVTAAAIILGLAVQETDEEVARKQAYALAKDFIGLFEGLHGTSLCRELLAADMRTEEGMKRIKEEGLFSKACPVFVRDAARIVDEILASNGVDQRSQGQK